MPLRSSTWSIVLGFTDRRALRTPPSVDGLVWWRSVCLDTLDAVLAGVEPANVAVVTDDAVVAEAARDAGAVVTASGRDLNLALTNAAQAWAHSHPHRSCAAVLGPLPLVDGETFSAALRACAATESALLPDASGGTVVLSHHDPARLAPRFGGSSAGRHQRVAVRVGSHLAKMLDRSLPEGARPAGERSRTLTREAPHVTTQRDDA